MSSAKCTFRHGRENIISSGFCYHFHAAQPHTLRRTFASTLILRGANIYAVSRLLGHSSVELTARAYAFLAPSTLVDTMRLLQY